MKIIFIMNIALIVAACSQIDIIKEADQERQMQNWSAAIDYYKLAIQQKPNDAVLHVKLALCLYPIGANEEARIYANRSLELDKNNYNALSGIAYWDYMLNDKFDSASVYYERALVIIKKPSNPWMRLNLVGCYLNLTRYDEALRQLDLIDQETPVPYTLFFRAICNYHLNQKDLAVEYLLKSFNFSKDLIFYEDLCSGRRLFLSKDEITFINSVLDSGALR